ncbi:MAG: glutaredoxin family protein [Elusimicrobiota bacterium]|nr:glutaredoxin family protein [Elusimicrobiota bacterium]
MVEIVRSVALALALAGTARAAEAPGSLEVFSRPGCPHCEKAEAWLLELQARRPLRVLRHDISRDPAAAARLERLSREAGRPGGLVPSFLAGGRLVVGFRDAQTTGRELEGLLAGSAAPPGDEVDLPWLGRVSASRSGLLAFTVAVGLADGFNPCAMWVLLFLLSLLTHVHSRPRMIAIAGTFLIASGAVYYLFMTAWLGVFLALGRSRALQTTLGVLALAAAAVHIKDALAPGRGPSLNIPESAKPGIYARVREIVTAQNLPAALAAAAVLAVGVNVVEVLCSAGLPAVYTQVLASHALGFWERQGYLLVYVGAYMLDDGVMTAAAVATLSMTRLQERGGRVLQLLSGGVLAALGLALLF